MKMPVIGAGNSYASHDLPSIKNTIVTPKRTLFNYFDVQTNDDNLIKIIFEDEAIKIKVLII